MLVAQVAGPEDAPIARLTELTLDGERERVHEVSLGRFADAAPAAIAGTGPWEVLFTTTWGVYLVVRFDEDGGGEMFELDLPVAIIGLWSVASAARGGFIAAAKLGFMSSALLAIDLDGVTVQEIDAAPRGAPAFSGAEPGGWGLSALDGTGHVYGAFVDTESSGIVALRIDTRTFPFVVDRAEVGTASEASPTPLHARATLAPGGVVIGVNHGDPVGVRSIWLDESLGVRAEAIVTTGGRAAWSVGVGGDGPDHLAMMIYSDTGNMELRVAVAETPGIVTGGARALVSGLDGGARFPIAWTGLPGSISVAYQRGALEVMTLCAAP
jgi:hypothetical protein